MELIRPVNVETNRKKKVYYLIASFRAAEVPHLDYFLSNCWVILHRRRNVRLQILLNKWLNSEILSDTAYVALL